MKAGILVTSIGNFGEKGYYNSQEIGLATALDKLFDCVKIYKLIDRDGLRETVEIPECKNAFIEYIPSRSIGINGISGLKDLDNSLDILIHFSDTQLIVPYVYSRCNKNNVKYIPYIGVVESHSTNRFVRILINALYRCNVSVYKKCKCIAKTPVVQQLLEKQGVKDVRVMPVGLNQNLLHSDSSSYSINEIKHKYGIDEADKVLLFIGRMIEEKNPLGMVELFKQIIDRDRNYKLIMVGDGPLSEEVNSIISKLGLSDYILRITKVPNDQIWELYTIADFFINLNRQEIFGMAILEALYYGCTVIALEAPGPNFIIENGVSGFIEEDDAGIVDKVINPIPLSGDGRQRVLEQFTWDIMAKGMLEMLSS